MYDISQIETCYEFVSCVTFCDGHKSTFCKKEHVKAVGSDGLYIFTMLGSSEETVDGMAPVDWSDIILQFAKALYPITLRVSGQGDFMAVENFEELRRRWKEKCQKIIDYYNSSLIEEESQRFALVMETEDKFFHTLKENVFYRLFFWTVDQPVQQVVIRDFPSYARLAIFSFQEKKYDENGGLCYETYEVKDEGSGRLLSGHAKLRLSRDFDGLPKEIHLKARVEEAETGYFTKEITIKRL